MELVLVVIVFALTCGFVVFMVSRLDGSKEKAPARGPGLRRSQGMWGGRIRGIDGTALKQL